MPYTLNTRTKTIQTQEGGLIPCGQRTYTVLEYLTKHTNKVCSRSELQAALQQADAKVDLMHISSIIARIRQRLGTGVIQTCGSDGYKLLEGFVKLEGETNAE